MGKFEANKADFLDSMGRPLTQSLFLEVGYDTKFAVYSLKSYDHDYKGKVYPSLKRLYLECEDPTEYEFANRYLLDWDHWRRLKGNAMLNKHFEEWSEELELKIRSQAVRDIMSQCADNLQGSFQAAKWLADKGWDKRLPGRPSKQEVNKEKRMQERIDGDFEGDIARMSDYKGKIK